MEAAVAVERPASGVRERLAAFVDGISVGLGHVRRRENALLYVRGLVEHGGRKSLQPTLFRLGEDAACYESVQQFLADSPWDPQLLVRACAERVAPEIGVLAWVVDDTGIKKDGKHSPGVKRQWSGTLGKIDNCQITVSVHAVGQRGTLPLGFALSLPEEWCEDLPRRRKAKIPDEVVFQTKPQLAASLVEQASRWEAPKAPVLADQAYGDDTGFRSRLHEGGREYVVAVSPNVGVFGPETRFTIPERTGKRGRPPTVPRPDRRPESVRALAERLPAEAFKTLPCRTTAAGEELEGRFAFVRVVAAHAVEDDHLPPRFEWLIIEWPKGEEAPSDYWLSNLGEDEPPERLARLARLRWVIELDYRQLKGELGLDHYEGRSYLGFHHHTALVTCAHAFLTLERLDPKARRPA
ncbi:MAG: IS701 family transposase [Mycolicibacterium hassiacum]|uniref:IS701 family transposase n=1 Tax=Mycolicibacterium hassiacum TaxID=46351 RepID=UPI0023F92D89|nr:IS701 family transposase [Mycolicibacterium hassiacum]MBX5485421.1 IS701 family transposase [Mycolicibacterium hassiacum]